MKNRAKTVIAMGLALAAGMDTALSQSASEDRKPAPHKTATLPQKVWKKKKANKRAQNQARNRNHG